MTDETPTGESHDGLAEAARRQAAREAGKTPSGVMRRLAQIGVLGWMIVVPMLLGMYLGRWLDRTFDSGVFWTAPLLMVGLALGCWSAWKWMQRA